MDTISVKNTSGQVSHFSVTGPTDPRLGILEQRIARGELTRVDADATSETVVVVVAEIDAGVRDEKGDLLKSVHGGGLDPDAAGDALGRPSVSGLTETQARKDAEIAVKAVATQRANADEADLKVSPTTVAAAAAAGPAAKQPKRSASSDSQQ